jgi:hypothetical protein
VSVQMIDLRTGAPAWWALNDAAVTYAQTFVLDLTASPTLSHGSPEPGWQEWGSHVFIGEAGCYTLAATWPGGSWRVIVAAGR